MAEVHVIGQILSAENFPKQNIFCKWSVQFGKNWKIVAGHTEGQTQVDSSEYDNICYWYHPIDLHLATKGIQGWPKLYIQIFHLDWVGRVHLFGYGYLPIPTSPGCHKLNCFTWRPIGTLKERLIQYFLGESPQLKHPDLVYSSPERFKLNTETMGIVNFEVGVIMRNFEKFGIEYN